MACGKKCGSKGWGKDIVLRSKTVPEWLLIVFIVLIAGRIISLYDHSYVGPSEFQEASPAS